MPHEGLDWIGRYTPTKKYKAYLKKQKAKDDYAKLVRSTWGKFQRE